MKNISFMVADGYALPNQPGAIFHFGQIPAGYARVGVSKVIPAFRTMELDIPGGDDEKTLGEVELGIVLWKKKYIVFPDSALRPPTPPSRNAAPTPPNTNPAPTSPSRNPPPQSPPAFPDDNWETTSSPSPVPSRQPTDAPPSNLIKRKLFTKGSSPVSKRANIPKKVKTPEKLPCEKSMEELEQSTRAEVRAFFARKKEERQDPIQKLLKSTSMEVKDRTVDNLYNPPPKPLSDYERGINKQLSSQMEERKRGKQVAQLGEQEVQSIPPLIVSSDKAAVSTNIAAQPESETSLAYLELAYAYVLGQPLVTDPASLTTQLWKLHNWYMAASKKEKFYFMAGVKEEHFFQEYAVQVEFSELFQMYNQRALDKSIISCYCL